MIHAAGDRAFLKDPRGGVGLDPVQPDPPWLEAGWLDPPPLGGRSEGHVAGRTAPLRQKRQKTSGAARREIGWPNFIFSLLGGGGWTLAGGWHPGRRAGWLG